MTEKIKEVVAKAAETIAQAAATTAPAVHVDSTDVVAAVQTVLRAKNYPNVGPVTGEGGPKTESGLLDFQNRNALPLTGKIDKPTLEALQTAPPKELPVEQANATEDEIAPKVEAVQKNIWTKFWAKVGAIPSIIGALLLGIINNLGDAIAALQPLKTFLSEWLDGIDKLTLVTVAAFATALVSGVLWFNSRQTGNALTDAYRKGTTGNDNKEAAP